MPRAAWRRGRAIAIIATYLISFTGLLALLSPATALAYTLSDVSVSPSLLTANFSTSWTYSFTPTPEFSQGSKEVIQLSAPPDAGLPTCPSTALDCPAYTISYNYGSGGSGFESISANSATALISPGTNAVQVAFTTGNAPSGPVKITVAGVINPPAGIYPASDFAIEGTANSSYLIFANSPATAVTGVSAVPATLAESATTDWTVSFTTSPDGAMTDMTRNYSDTITLSAPLNTTLPMTAGDYQVDGTPAEVVNASQGDLAVITVPNPIAASTKVTVAVNGVQNPPTGNYAANAFSVYTSIDTVAAHPAAGLSFSTTPSGVAFTPSSTDAGAGGAAWTVGFTATSGLAAGDTVTLAAPTSMAWPSLASDFTVDGTTAASLAGGGTDTAVLTLPGGFGTVATGGKITLGASGVTNPPAGTYAASTFSVATSKDPVPATGPSPLTFVNVPATAVGGVSFAAAYQLNGASTPWTVTFITSARGALTTGNEAVTLTAPPGTQFSSSSADYSVDAQPVAQVDATGSSVTIDVPAGIQVGDSSAVTVVADNTTNPATGAYPASDLSVATSVDTTPVSPARGLAFGATVTAVTWSVSPLAKLQPSTWTVTFTTPSSLAAGGSVTLGAPSGTAFPSATADYSVNGQAPASVGGGGTNGVTLTLPAAFTAVAGGGTVKVQALGTTNPAAGTYSGPQFSVSTSQYPAAAHPASGFTFPPGVSGIAFSTDALVAGAMAFWSVQFTTSAEGALTKNTDDITLDFPPGTDPSNAEYYVDNTLVTGWATSTNPPYVRLQVPVGIPASSQVTVAVDEITNPPAAAYPASDFGVSTTSDPATVPPAAGLTFTPQATVASGVSFLPSSMVAAARTTWSVDFVPYRGLTGGSDSVTLTAPAGTVFSGNAADYSLGLGPTTVPVGVVAAAGSRVTITVPDSANLPGKVPLTIVAANTMNPMAGTYPAADFTLTTSEDTSPAYPQSGLTFTPGGAGSSGSVVLQASPLPLRAGGVATVSGTVYDAVSQPRPDVTVDLSATAGTLPASVVTDAHGRFSTTFTAPAASRQVTLTATVAGTVPAASSNLTFAVSAGPAASLTLALSPSSVPAGGASTVSGVVYDRSGVPVGGATVGIAATAPGFGTSGSSAVTTVTTDVYGQYRATYRAPATAGPVLLDATVSAAGASLHVASVLAVESAAGSPVGGNAAFTLSSGSVAATSAASQTPSATIVASGGTGAAGIIQYGADPEAAPGPAGATGYFDAGLSAGNTFASATIQVCGLSGPETSLWWNGSAWQPVTPQAFANGCLFLGPLLPGGTSPTLAQLGGTAFALAPPVLLPPTGSLNFRPSPLAPTGSMTAGQSVSASVYAEDTAGNAVADATIYLSFSGDGAAAVGTTALTATPQPFIADAAGQLQVTYTAPAALPASGTDTLTAASAATSPSLSATDTYSFATTTATTTTAGGGTAPAGPVVSGIQPASGPAAGGTAVTITGSDLTGATAVDFGGTPASSFTVDSNTRISAISPAGTGTVDVTVTTPYGFSATGSPDLFVYRTPVSQTVPAAPPFTDVPPGYWASAAIGALAARGIVDGFPDGTFGPEAPVSRAQFVKMLDLTLGLKPVQGATPFTDVPASAWYAGYVEAALQAGIAGGVGPTRFEPDAALTREAMALMVARALKLTSRGTPLAFTDASRIDGWALTGVEEAVAAGLMRGLPDGTFAPLAPATRAQAAAVLAAALSRGEAGSSAPGATTSG